MSLFKNRTVFSVFLALLLGLSLLRISFAWQNNSFFEDIKPSLFLIGVYFDTITLALLGLPVFLFINPLTNELKGKGRAIVLFLTKSYLVLLSLLVLVLNTWDIAYYSYTQKRSGFSYFLHVLTGTESGSLAGEFLAEFWWLPLLFLLLFVPVCLLIIGLELPRSSKKKQTIWLRFFAMLLMVVLLARGGFQLRPIGIIDATALSSLEQAPIVLNTTFTVIKTTDDGSFDLLSYHNEKELAELLPKASQGVVGEPLPAKTNVVVIILESFGSNYAGPNAPASYTPFLDSLLQESLFFEHAISNGRTSMDAVPAILASMPSWLPESYILSPFCSNQLNSLPELLKEQGYATSFYHGAKEGSMNFKSFTKAIGVTSYVGLESYPEQSHFDGNWGVWDHQMLPFFGRELGRAKQPFFSALFTLSSHHPYQVPAQFEKRLKAGPEPLCRSIAYTDLSLRQFFKRFQNEDWFKNTLFVITADHVGPTCQQQFQTLDWRYRIPIAFYHPSRKLPKPVKNLVFQQIDIMPTVLDLLGFKKSAFQLGSSCYDPKQRQKMVYDNGNLISFIRNGSKLVPVAWTPFVKRKYTSAQHQMSRQMSALYQFYMNSLIENHCARQTIK